jgi:hypothetical protein
MPPDGTATTIVQSPEDLRAKNAGPDGREMRGDTAENKQVEPIMSDRWFR